MMVTVQFLADGTTGMMDEETVVCPMPVNFPNAAKARLTMTSTKLDETRAAEDYYDAASATARFQFTSDGGRREKAHTDLGVRAPDGRRALRLVPLSEMPLGAFLVPTDERDESGRRLWRLAKAHVGQM